MAKTIYHTKRPVLLKMKPCIIGLFTYSCQRILLLHTHYKLFSLTTLYLHSYKTLTTYTTQQHTAQASLYTTILHHPPTLPLSLSLTTHKTQPPSLSFPTLTLKHSPSTYTLYTLTHSQAIHPSHTYITSWLSCLHSRWDILYFKAKLTASRLPPLKEFC